MHALIRHHLTALQVDHDKSACIVDIMHAAQVQLPIVAILSSVGTVRHVRCAARRKQSTGQSYQRSRSFVWVLWRNGKIPEDQLTCCMP